MSEIHFETHSMSKKCPECGSSTLVQNFDTGEVICGHCGLVVENINVDRGPEWRAYSFEEKADRSRVGSPITILQPDKGLVTVISKNNRDASGREVSAATKVQMWRLRKWQVRARFPAAFERNLLHALGELDRMVDNLHISADTHREAADIYRRILGKGLVRGRSISSMAAASLYAACRRMGKARSLKEIASVTLLSKKEIARCYRLILKEMLYQMPITDPRNYITKIASKINLDEKHQGLAMQLLMKGAELKATTGKDPIGLAAATLYMACLMNGENRTQREIASAADVTEVTVRNRYKGLKAALGMQDDLNGLTLPSSA